MKTAENEPTPDELAAMAYADGELDEAARRAFEARMANSPGLAREVTHYRRLHALAARAAPIEPMDVEWRRLARDPLQRGLTALGWSLAAVGCAALAVGGCWMLAQCALPAWAKWGCGALLGASVLLFAAALRARMRTRPYDPYTEIQR